MRVLPIAAQSILTPQTGGFLASGPFPFTHALSPYTGCGFGLTTCGMYCYAQHLPNWVRVRGQDGWGEAVYAKPEAARLLARELSKKAAEDRRGLRIFMSSVTDPYQPAEESWQLTRACLEVFCTYPDLDLLVIQTRSPLAARDFDLLAQIPYVMLSMTVETDDQRLLKRLRGGPSLQGRLTALREAAQRGIRTQAAVAPCLPHSAGFAESLKATGVSRVIVDTVVDGDGSHGRRTRTTPWAHVDGWDDKGPAFRMMEQLSRLEVPYGYSREGFSGIPPRHREGMPESVPGGTMHGSGIQ